MVYKKFYEFGISDAVLKSLSDMGFEEPTPIQKIAIPPALKGRDLIGQAQTGTGKTAAFGIPLIERSERGKNPYAIALVPTRELAVQVAQELNKIGQTKGVLSVAIYGGQSMEGQIRSLRRGVDIVVGTPGRVIDHIQRKTLILKDIKTVVFDEADEMLAMGFIDDMETILKEIPKKRQVLLFSATLPKPIRTLAMKFMTDPESVQVNVSELVVAKIKQVFYEVREEDKIKALTRLLDVEDPSLTLVFCHTKREVDDVSSRLQKMGYHAGAIHGDFTQDHRDEMMRKFKKGDIDILVATDVAARGLDITDVSHVINFSIPQDPDSYVHRIGRTGRAGKSGIAITFVTPREYRQLRMIEQSAKTKIKKGALPTKAEVMKAREDGIVADFNEAITQGKHADYIRLAETLLAQHPAPVVAAAALSLIAGDQAIDEIRETSGGEGVSAKGFVKLFMTIGRKDKIQVVDIVKSISAEAGIPARRIGNIALYDTFSFVEVPADLADRVISAINDVVLKGRKVRIGHARKMKGR
ncbi:MAG: DEAD/DEAH box helicase [Nitrospiraceae bacterium]|nr:DEAD/DEAH box helicase [Nitrospiraceae bacterium]